MRRNWVVFACTAWLVSALFALLSGVVAIAFILVGVLVSWLFTTLSVIPEMYSAALSGDAKKHPRIFSGTAGKILLVSMFLLPATMRQFGPAVYYGFGAGLCAGVGTQFLLILRSKLLCNYPDPPSGVNREPARSRKSERGRRRRTH